MQGTGHINSSLYCIHLCTGEAGGYGVQAGGVQGLLVPRQAVPGEVQAAGLVTVARGEAAPDGGHAPLLRRHRRSHLHLHLATGHLGPGGVAPGGHLLALLLAAVLVHQAHEHADNAIDQIASHNNAGKVMIEADINNIYLVTFSFVHSSSPNVERG